MTTTTPASGASRRNPRHRGQRPGTDGGNRRTASSGQANGGRVSESSVDLSPSTTPVVSAADFDELHVPKPIVAALTRLGVTTPFPIQTATLPDSLAGRDVLGRGKTGSGKTIAFAIPTVVRLANSTARREAKHPRALILVPTRELANQVAETFAPIAQAMGLKVTTVFARPSM